MILLLNMWGCFAWLLFLTWGPINLVLPNMRGSSHCAFIFTLVYNFVTYLVSCFNWNSMWEYLFKVMYVFIDMGSKTFLSKSGGLLNLVNINSADRVHLDTCALDCWISLFRFQRWVSLFKEISYAIEIICITWVWVGYLIFRQNAASQNFIYFSRFMRWEGLYNWQFFTPR